MIGGHACRIALLVAVATLSCAQDATTRGHARSASLLASLEGTYPAALPLLEQASRYPARADAPGKPFVVTPPSGKPRAELRRDALDPFAIAIPGGALHVRHVGARSVAGRLEDGALVYEGISEGTDLVTFATAKGVEELARIDSASRRLSYELDLPGGWNLRVAHGTTGVIEVLDDRGTSRLRFGAKTAWDAGGREAPVNVAVAGNRITLTVPDATPGPVLVDPTWLSAGTMLFERARHTATLLPDGKVLLAGGWDSTGNSIAGCELYDPSLGTFTSTGSLATTRVAHTATLLASGKVLVAGGNGAGTSTEIYDPATGSFSRGGPMQQNRQFAPAVRLPSGDVLFLGGRDASGAPTSTAEIYDPQNGTFTLLGASMAIPRYQSKAVLLPSGQVLVVGDGQGEIYDPATQTFALASPMVQQQRAYPTLTLLPSGQVLVAGGFDGGAWNSPAFGGAELYDPVAQTFTSAGQLNFARGWASDTLLPTGEVLLTGGETSNPPSLQSPPPAVGQAEMYEPTRGTFVPVAQPELVTTAYQTATLLPSGNVLLSGGGTPETIAVDSAQTYLLNAKTLQPFGGLAVGRVGHSATLLPATGKVFVVGGSATDGTVLSSTEIFDPDTRNFTPGPSLPWPASQQAATLLLSGKVLIAGGLTEGMSANNAALYDPSTNAFSNTGGLLNLSNLDWGTLLPSGQVLVTGVTPGQGGSIEDVEVYDPVAGQFASTGSFVTPRYQALAAALQDGTVLFAGGGRIDNDCPAMDCDAPLDTAEIYDPAAGRFRLTAGTMSVGRLSGAVAVLGDGRVLVTGGVTGACPQQTCPPPTATAEIYDPTTGSFSMTNSMSVPRALHTTTTLVSGKVLVVGGVDANGNPRASAELYDPMTGVFTATKGAPAAARASHDAVLLPSHEVLIVGGVGDNGNVSAAELYDPQSETFSWANPGAPNRTSPTLTLLPNHQLLLAGGIEDSTPSFSAELLDPATGQFSPTGSLAVARTHATATLLSSGRVLVAGGRDPANNPTADAEEYDPQSGRFTAAGKLFLARAGHTATLLPTGNVLLAGGSASAGLTTSVELFDASKGTFSAIGHLQVARVHHSAALLSSGQVVVAGGEDASKNPVTTLEVFDVPSGQTVATSTTEPSSSTATIALTNGNVLVATDSSFRELVSASDIRTFGPPVTSPTSAKLWLSGEAAICSPAACQDFSSSLQSTTDSFEQSFTSAITPMERLADGSLFLLGTGSYAIAHPLPAGVVRPTIASLSTSSIHAGDSVTITGTGFEHVTAAGADALPALPLSVPLVFFMPSEGGGPIFGAVGGGWTDTMLTWKVPQTSYPGPGWVHVVVDGVPSAGVFVTLAGSPNATPCDSDSECINGHCVGTTGARVCCNSACSGGCESCFAADQAPGGHDGTCGARKQGSVAVSGCEPTGDPTCSSTGHCNGQGDCDYPASGKACSSSTGASGVCASGVCVATPPPKTTCNTTADCPAGEQCDVTGHCASEASFPAQPTDPGSCACGIPGGSSQRPDARWLLALLIVLVTLVIARSARAEDSRVEQARTELRKGLALYNAGDAERALEFFLRSRAIFPAKGNTKDAANCLRVLGRYDEALELYEELLASFGADLDAEDRVTVPQSMAWLRAQVGSVRVSANVDGTVVIDGRARGKLPLNTAVRVMPGHHQLRVIRDGYVASESDIDVAVGATLSVDARLEPLQASGGLRVEDAALPDADVLVDGVALGPAPWEGRLAPGVHVVRTRKGDSGSAPARAAVLQGQTTLLRLSSSRLGPSLRLTVTPPTADLALDGVPLGKGRWEGPLPEGTYRLEASEEGYFPQSITFRQTVDRGPTDAETALTLNVDESSPRWPRRRSAHVVVGALLGYGVGPSFGSDAEGACPSSCSSRGLANGLLVGVRVGYELPARLTAELTFGHASLSESVSRSAAAGFLENGAPVTYALHDVLRLNGYLLGAGASFWQPIGFGLRMRSRITVGVLAAESTDVLTGTASAGSQSVPLGIPGAGSTLTSVPFFVMPEVGLEIPLGALRLGLHLAALFVASDGPVYAFGPAVVPNTCTAQQPNQVGCARDSAVLENERAFRPFGLLLPQLTADYAF
ncbi:MAG TPA: kelch repeat-containing protein [Polyangiaceae bacterium]